MITLTLIIDILVLLSLDAKFESSEKQAHFLATMEKNPKQTHAIVLVYMTIYHLPYGIYDHLLSGLRKLCH